MVGHPFLLHMDHVLLRIFQVFFSLLEKTFFQWCFSCKTSKQWLLFLECRHLFRSPMTFVCCIYSKRNFSFSSRWIGEGCSVLAFGSVHFYAGILPWKAFFCSQPLGAIQHERTSTEALWEGSFLPQLLVTLFWWAMFRWQSFIVSARCKNCPSCSEPIISLIFHLDLPFLPALSRSPHPEPLTYPWSPAASYLPAWETPHSTHLPGPGCGEQASSLVFQREHYLMEGPGWRGLHHFRRLLAV